MVLVVQSGASAGGGEASSEEEGEEVGRGRRARRGKGAVDLGGARKKAQRFARKRGKASGE